MNFTIEQSESEIYTPTAGLAFVGHALDRKTTLRKTLRTVVKRHGIPNVDLVRVYAGILATGKSDFEAVENVRDDDFFRLSMGIGQMPSSSRLRQRFDEDAAALTPLIDDSLSEIVANMDVSVTPLPKRLDKHRHVPLDIDVFPMDNSGTKKEGVAYTYKGYDGYAPIAAYLGQEGWSLGCELRPGSQHSQKDFVPFLDRVLQRARRVTRKPILLRLDSGHDAAESRQAVAQYEKVDHIIKLNPRTTYTTENLLPCFEKAGVAWKNLRKGKDYATLSLMCETDDGQQRLVVRLIRRTCDIAGQMFLSGPDYELDGWWTTLKKESYSNEEIIDLYKDHATSEQFHSEFKTDLDLERLPSGKFATNAGFESGGAGIQHPAMHGAESAYGAGITCAAHRQASSPENCNAGVDLSGSAPGEIRPETCAALRPPQSRISILQGTAHAIRLLLTGFSGFSSQNPSPDMRKNRLHWWRSRLPVV